MLSDKLDCLKSAMPFNSFLPGAANESVSVVAIAIATMVISKENRIKSAMPFNSLLPGAANESVFSFAFAIANP
jgi:hypothetical protein